LVESIKKFNLIKDPPDPLDFLFRVNWGRVEKLPYPVDHTPFMSHVKDQGYLGSCVAFALCAVKEFQEQKEHKEEVERGKYNFRAKKGLEHYNLSEQWLYYKTKEIDPWPDQEGTSFRYALKVLNKIGVPVEHAWPYDDKIKGKPEAWASLVALWSLIGSYWRLVDLYDLKTALVFSPCVIGIACFKEIFYVDKSGIVPYPESTAYYVGNHAVCAVGFDDKKELIKFKNSWGVNWGDCGYGYISYKYFQDFMIDSWTFMDISVTKEHLKGKIPSLR